MSKFLVQRTQVELGRGYQTYRDELRRDFCHACAYCTMTELEAAAVGYQIDHYHPREQGGADDYGNLYWACALCNSKKRDYWPTPTAAAAGRTIVRVDVENPEEHITSDPNDATRVIEQTEQGKFNIQFLGLNFARMTKLRRIRHDAGYSATLVRQGLRALSTMRLDELPKELKAKALQINERLRRTAEDVEGALERVLVDLAIEHSRSDLIDREEDGATTRERLAYLRHVGVLKNPKPKK